MWKKQTLGHLERFGWVLGNLRTKALICDSKMQAESMPCSPFWSFFIPQVLLPWDDQVGAVNLSLLQLSKPWCPGLCLPAWALGRCYQRLCLLSWHWQETCVYQLSPLLYFWARHPASWCGHLLAPGRRALLLLASVTGSSSWPHWGLSQMWVWSLESKSAPWTSHLQRLLDFWVEQDKVLWCLCCSLD